MEFRFVATLKVQFRDVDAMGHVNNAVYLHYLETARMEFYEQVFGTDGFRRFPYILAEVRVRYLHPAHLKDLLELGIRVSEVGRKSFRLEYLIRDAASGRVLCEAESVQVMYDYATQRSFEIPEEWRKVIEARATVVSRDAETSTGGSR